MKEKYFINARIIDPSQNLDELGGLIVDSKGKIKAVGKSVKKANIPTKVEKIDLKGKVLSKPVYSLLGGPNTDKIPAYASMLGFNVTDMDLVKKRALEYKSKGYKAQKWFFRYGPTKGKEGLMLNIELVKTLKNLLESFWIKILTYINLKLILNDINNLLLFFWTKILIYINLY